MSSELDVSGVIKTEQLVDTALDTISITSDEYNSVDDTSEAIDSESFFIDGQSNIDNNYNNNINNNNNNNHALVRNVAESINDTTSATTISSSNTTTSITTSNTNAITCLLPPQFEDAIGHITSSTSNMVRNNKSNLNNNNITNNNNNNNNPVIQPPVANLHTNNNNNNNNNNNTLNNILNNNHNASTHLIKGGLGDVGGGDNWWPSEINHSSGGHKVATTANGKLAIANGNANNNQAMSALKMAPSLAADNNNHLPKAILKYRPNSHPFQMRTLTLIPNVEVKVGRAVARHPVSENNAIFDCKVLSRNHAVLWYSDDKFYIRDMGSSNGTFVNNQRLSQSSLPSEKFEICSGDIVQFGVDVMENARKETHGCIVATIKLFLPDGRETKASQFTGMAGGNSSVPAEDLYRLHQYIQEAIQREHILEQKLSDLQKLVLTAKQNVNHNWQAMVDEDRLLNRIDILESKLQALQKNYGEDKLREEMRHLQEDKMDYQHAAKEALRRVYQERYEAVQKLSNIELTLRNSEDEGTVLRDKFLKSESDLNESLSRLAAVQQQYDELNREYKKLEEKLNALETKAQEEDGQSDAFGHEQQPINQVPPDMDLSLRDDVPKGFAADEKPPPASLMRLFEKSDLVGSQDIINTICNAPLDEELPPPMEIPADPGRLSKLWYKLRDVEKDIFALDCIMAENRTFDEAKRSVSVHGSQMSLNNADTSEDGEKVDEEESDNKSITSTSTLVGNHRPKSPPVLFKLIIDQLKEVYNDVLTELGTVREEIPAATALAENESSPELTELEQKVTALEQENGDLRSELENNDRPTRLEYDEKVQQADQLQMDLLSVQLKVANLREQLVQSEKLNETLRQEVDTLKDKAQRMEEELAAAVAKRNENLSEQCSGGGGGGDDGREEAAEAALEAQLVTDPIVEVEEELALYKEKYGALVEAKSDLQDEIDTLKRKYEALLHKSTIQMLVYMSPVLVAVLSYFVVWPYL